MSPRKWVYFICALLVLIVISFIGNALVAGIFYLLVLIFEESSAYIVFKWIFIILSAIELSIFIPYTYKSVQKGM